jgi:phosphomannomutase
MLEEALVRGITEAGLDAVRIGMGPTPMLYYAEAVLDDVDGGIEITGSHNPANYNGFKMVFQGRPVFRRRHPATGPDRGGRGLGEWQG